MQAEQRRNFIINTTYWIFLIVLIYLFLQYVLGYVFPLIIGFAAAFLLKPQVDRLMHRMHISRKIASFFVLFLFYLVFGLLFTLLGVQIYYGLRTVIHYLPILLEQDLLPFLDQIRLQTEQWLLQLPPPVSHAMNHVLEHLPEQLSDLTAVLISGASALATTLPGGILSCVVAVISSFFISGDYPGITDFVVRQLNKRNTQILFSIKGIVVGTIFRLIRSYVLLLLITFVELLVGFWILKIDHPFAIAATVALIDLLPVLGVGLVLLPWSVLAMIQNDFSLAIGLVILFIGIEIVRNILEPKIIGKQTGLSPILSLAAMFVGFRLFGFTGVIAVPIMIIVLKKLNDEQTIHIFR